ncbi:MAG: phage portal protein, partial [Clostridia bacterium]|nr:phage portal protein [Clostridia bacterium]
MKNPFNALFRARDKPRRRRSPQDSVSAAPSFFFGSSGAGKSVTVQTAIQLSTVYACVRIISETIASLPLGVYQVEGEGTKKAMDHPLYRLLHDEPNSELTSFVLREVMLAHLLLYGNSYCQIIRTGRNRITGLYPLLPDKMSVDRDKDGVLTYVYTTSSGATVTLAPEDVLHIPGLGFDGVMGYSPIAIERNAIGLGI